jgi:hypothetical protein
MNKKNLLNGLVAISILLLYPNSKVVAQNIAINATGTAAVASAMLDISSTSSGLLVPRMTAAQRAAIAAPATSLLVYQTDAGAMGVGYYFYNGAAWVPFGTNNGGWGLTGNTGTTSGTNYLGTTDGQALDFRTNGTLRFRVANADQVHALALGTAALPFYSWSADPNTGIYNIGADILGFSTGGTERIRAAANGRVGINTATTEGRLDVRDAFATAVASYGTIVSRNTNATGTGLVSLGQNGTINALVNGSAVSFCGVSDCAYNYYTTGGVGEGIIIQDAFGAQWLVGHWTGAAYRKILGTGTVSTIVKDLKDEYVVMNCPETPENQFMDYGIGKLVNGKAIVKIDPIITKNIIVSQEHPLKVFVQLEGECKGVYVTNKTAESFEVIELNGGTSNVDFSYSIVATRGDETVTNPQTGASRVAKYDTRFEKAPAYKENLIQKEK